jgi:FKBP-type peptidyl-prolyl cis-trans isomerase FklB
MKFQINRIPLILSIVVLTFTFTANISAKQKTKLVSEKEKISYSIGLSIGNNFKQQKIEIEMDSLAQGIEDALTGAKQKMTPEEIRQTMEAFRRQMQARSESNRQAASSGNQVKGEKFLAQNKKRKNVVTLASGLQYEVVKKGSGKRPGLTDTVVTHYKGMLIGGKVFDSSYKRGQPAEFPVNGVIKGWTEALQLMQQGAKWKLYIPADLAYGSRGAGNAIGPNEALIFEIELLEVK